MDNLDLKQRAVFNQAHSSDKDLFEDLTQDYKSLALTLIEFNKAIYAMGDHLIESLLTYSRLSTKNQIKG
jgi:hypothetical protein